MDETQRYTDPKDNPKHAWQAVGLLVLYVALVAIYVVTR